MEASMSLNALVRLPITTPNSKSHPENNTIIRHSISSTRNFQNQNQNTQNHKHGKLQTTTIIEAKVKRGMMARRNDQRRQPLPAMPKIEEDGNPKFVVFIRMSNVYLWYPLSVITGGTTAKIMVAAKDNFLGKYIYKDAIARNLASVIYKDEKEIIRGAIKQYRVLRSADEFKYGYKLVQSTNLRVALSTSDVIELPPKEELKTVVDKVFEFFGDAKESFGKLTAIDSSATEDEKEDSKEKTNPK